MWGGRERGGLGRGGGGAEEWEGKATLWELQLGTRMLLHASPCHPHRDLTQKSRLLAPLAAGAPEAQNGEKPCPQGKAAQLTDPETLDQTPEFRAPHGHLLVPSHLSALGLGFLICKVAMAVLASPSRRSDVTHVNVHSERASHHRLIVLMSRLGPRPHD